MEAVHTRIKELRIRFHLSQDYVARYLGIDCPSFALLEDGHHDVTNNMLAKLSRLFGVSPDALLHETQTDQKIHMLARSPNATDEKDESEVRNLFYLRNQFRVRTKAQT